MAAFGDLPWLCKEENGGFGGGRTHDQEIKSLLLYH